MDTANNSRGPGARPLEGSGYAKQLDSTGELLFSLLLLSFFIVITLRSLA